jgi:murein DD-endopeptidase MepM/ murein hydrolase activator NlpD
MQSPFQKIKYLILLLILLPSISGASGIKVLPDAVAPGDAFMVRVFSDEPPEGEFDNRPLLFSPTLSGSYIALSSTRIGMKPGKYSIYITVGGKTFRRSVAVVKKDFPSIRLTLPAEKVFLGPETRKRVDAEYSRLSSLWQKTTPPIWKGPFSPPIDTPVTSGFGIIRIINKRKRSIHRGADYKGKTGDPVRSINSGVVVLTDEQFYGGKTVLVNHGSGIYSIYMHLSAFRVREGQQVKKGEVIGLVGSSGRASGPHLHLSVKIQGQSINPLSLFNLPLE